MVPNVTIGVGPSNEPSAGDREIRESGSPKLTFMVQLDAQRELLGIRRSRPHSVGSLKVEKCLMTPFIRTYK
jgi:hypothetical protein